MTKLLDSMRMEKERVRMRKVIYPHSYCHVFNIPKLVVLYLISYTLVHYEQRKVISNSLIFAYTSQAILTTFSLFPPNIGGGNGDQLWAGGPPIYLPRVGLGSEAGWVLPCPPSLPTHGWGRGTRDSPYKRQTTVPKRPTLNVPRILRSYRN